MSEEIVPKRSHAHMRIAHTLFEALYKANTTRVEDQVFAFILRKSWGFQKKTVALSSDEISEAIGKCPRFVRVVVSRLVEYNMLEIVSPAKRGKPPTYKPNKVFSTWRIHRGSMEDLGDPPSAKDGGSGRSSKRIRSILHSDQIDPPLAKNEPSETPSLTHSTGQRAEPPKETLKENSKERSPQPPKGVACGFQVSGSSDEMKEKQKASLAKQLAKKLGNIPKSQHVERAWKIVYARPTPPDWNPTAWSHECKSQLARAIEAIAEDALNGKPVSSVLGMACHRAEQALGIAAARGEAS